MSEKSDVEIIAESIFQNIDNQTRSMYVVDGKKIDKAKYIDEILADALFLDDIGLPSTHLTYLKEPAKKKKDAKAIQNIVSSKFKKEVNIETVIPNDSNFDYEDFIPCVDYITSHEFLVRKKTGKISEISYDTWRKITPNDYRVDLGLYPALLVFDPYQKEPFKMGSFERKNAVYINSYNHPKWMRDEKDWAVFLSEEEIEDLYCPVEIMEFLEHLFPDEECREFVINWMHYALVGRCETYLVLNGKKGVGKGILCEKILQNLVGEINYRIAPESILESNFNAALENIRILVLDELRVDKETKLNKLKKYANQNQNVEKKGMDATRTTKVYYSAVISNNDLSDMLLTWDERRFSVVDLPEKSLLDAWGKDKIEQFIEVFEDEDIIKQFGYWVFYKGKSERYHEESAFKGKRYFSIVYNSLSEWKKVIFDMIMDKNVDDVFSLKDCRTQYKNRVQVGRFPYKVKTIDNFLDNFRWKDEKIGWLDFDEDSGEHYIVKEEKFKSSKSKKSESNDESEFDLL